MYFEPLNRLGKSSGWSLKLGWFSTISLEIRCHLELGPVVTFRGLGVDGMIVDSSDNDPTFSVGKPGNSNHTYYILLLHQISGMKKVSNHLVHLKDTGSVSKYSNRPKYNSIKDETLAVGWKKSQESFPNAKQKTETPIRCRLCWPRHVSTLIKFEFTTCWYHGYRYTVILLLFELYKMSIHIYIYR